MMNWLIRIMPVRPKPYNTDMFVPMFDDDDIEIVAPLETLPTAQPASGGGKFPPSNQSEPTQIDTPEKEGVVVTQSTQAGVSGSTNHKNSKYTKYWKTGAMIAVLLLVGIILAVVLS